MAIEKTTFSEPAKRGGDVQKKGAAKHGIWILYCFPFLKCVCLTKDREGDDHFCGETSHVFPSTKVVSLRRLLLRWDRVLKTEARLVAKARREMLRQRQNARKERRRAARAAETAWRKRLEAAKLRRQAQEQMRNPHV